MRRRVNRLMGGQRILQWHDFNLPDGAAIREHPSPSGHPWFTRFTSADTGDHTNPVPTSPIVDAGRAHNRNDATERNLGLRWNRYRRNYSSSADVVFFTDDGSSVVGVSVRNSRLTQSLGFRLRHVVSGPNIWQANSATGFPASATLQTITLNIGQAYRAKVEARGSCILFWVDGVLLGRAEPAVIVRHGFPGFLFSGANVASAGVHLDNWMATR
jgi:hypothetical protein